MYKPNGYSGGGCLIDPAVLIFFVPHFCVANLTLNPLYRTSFTALVKVVDRLLFCVLQLLRKGLYKIGRFPSVFASAFRIANALLPFRLRLLFLPTFVNVY